MSVIKKDKSREPYDRQKVILGLQKACSKRPVSDEQIRRIVEACEEEMFRHFEREVPSKFIGDTVSRCLREVDKLAYVRFAIVYHNFNDLAELIKEANEVKDAPVVGPKQRPLFDDQES